MAAIANCWDPILNFQLWRFSLKTLRHDWATSLSQSWNFSSDVFHLRCYSNWLVDIFNSMVRPRFTNPHQVQYLGSPYTPSPKKKGRQEGWKRKGGKEGWKWEGGEGKDGWKGGGKERQMEGRKEGREETGKSHSVPQGMTSSSTLFLRLETFLFLIHMNCVTRTFSHHSQPLLSVTISLCPVSDSLPAPFFYSAARDILGQRGNILTMSKAQLTNLTSSEGKPPWSLTVDKI